MTIKPKRACLFSSSRVLPTHVNTRPSTKFIQIGQDERRCRVRGRGELGRTVVAVFEKRNLETRRLSACEPRDACGIHRSGERFSVRGPASIHLFALGRESRIASIA